MNPNTYSLVLFSVCAFLIAGCIPTTTPPDAVAEVVHPEGYCDDLSGSWEMVSMTVTTPDTIYTQDQSEVPTLKVLNDTHWMFIRQSAEAFVFAQGGRYALEDGKYTEIVEYSAEPGNIDQAYAFECELLDDSWYHRGDLGGTFVDEIWQRVEAEEEAM